MSKKNSDNDRQGITINQLQKASMALDDLIWSIQKLDVRQLNDAATVLRNSLVPENISSSSAVRTYQSSNPNKRFLIGVLPRLFQDKALFPQNDDIAEFANSVLKLEMSRTEKRSRYEIIGKVICETDSLQDGELSLLVQGLEKLVEDKDKLAQMAEKKKYGNFSWNETLQDLLRKK